MVTRFGKGLARLVGRPVKYADGTGGWLTGETGQKMGESDSLDLLEVGNGQQQFPFCIRLPWRSGPIFSKFHLPLFLFFSQLSLPQRNCIFAEFEANCRPLYNAILSTFHFRPFTDTSKFGVRVKEKRQLLRI